ncbi:sugar phosphate nucleotidyltransferase [Metabacillus arenae]|uniref:NTP transferase domain-containing protein n=1 Tax=Metabacillus arenae TaxID=2771434 RepID=A0A926RZB3_9BACI|nr:sugar phosphate nucleotidyltransferase [Metabacillus arenae]MBD1378889.1 NTP transferase domain-containing protein [Metabacillus arenae]
MKAVILAGGEGKRLLPLTSHLPKPMVPILNKPVLEYTLELLKVHGYTEIYITVQYLSQMIKRHFEDGSKWGVNIHFAEDPFPLGTAGSVKMLESYLKEPFLVVSGDALMNFNLSKGMSFHQSKDTIATIVTKSFKHPLEYGVVQTDKEHLITDLTEKPRWNEVKSDEVNTGIYYFNPDIFRFIPEDQPSDFSQDIFPIFLKKGIRISAYKETGYWRDIGTFAQYEEAQRDLLQKKTSLKLKGIEVASGIWLEDGVFISERVKLNGPIYIGKDTHVEENCSIGPFTVIGNSSYIGEQSFLEKSIVWDHVHLQSCCHVQQALIANHAILSHSSKVMERSVLGEHVHLEQHVLIKENKRIWPNKVIEAETIVHDSVLTSLSWSSKLFGKNGIKGIANMTITPDFITKLSLTYAGCIEKNATILIGSDEDDFALIMKELMKQVLRTTGIDIVDSTEPMTKPIFRFGCYHHQNVQYGIFLFKNERNEMTIHFYDQNGYPIDHSFERKIENGYATENIRRSQKFGEVTPYYHLIADYFSAVKKEPMLPSNTPTYGIINHSIIPTRKILSHQRFSFIEFKSVKDIKMKVDGIFIFDRTGEVLKIMDEHGELLTEDQLLSLYIYTCRQDQNQDIYLPVTSSNHLQSYAVNSGKTIQLVSQNVREQMEAAGSPLYWKYDGIFFFLKLMSTLQQQFTSISSIHQSAQTSHVLREYAPCPIEKKGTVMRKLLEEHEEWYSDTAEGLKFVHSSKNWTVISPDIEKPFLNIYSHADEWVDAKQTAEYYIKKIMQYQKK